MSKFSSFLRRHAGEINGLGSALLTLAAGVALAPGERRKVEEAASALTDGAANIIAGINKVKELGAPTNTQVKNALAEILPDLLGGLVEAEVRKRLENKDAPAS